MAFPIPLDATDPFERHVRVLLVEDSFEYARLVRRALVPCSESIELEHVSTLAGAFEAQERAPADIVLLDLGLPDSDAEQTTERAASLARLAPVFVLTANEDRAAALRALSVGVEDYFMKNQVDTPTLVSALQKALARRASLDRWSYDQCADPEALRQSMRTRIAALGSGESLVLTLVELDYFDVLRDTWGKPWAHGMSRSTAATIAAAASEGAVVARLGEGTFALLDAADDSTRLIDQLALESRMACSPEISHRERYSVTASIGRVRIPDEGRHPAMLIDLALERAREAFRRNEDGPRFHLESVGASG